MKKLITYIAVFLALTSCGGFSNEPEVIRQSGGPVKVGIGLGGSATRSVAGADGLSTSWAPGDRIALWAVASDGTEVLSAQTFTAFGLDAQKGWFTSELESAMPEDSYIYCLSYPEPLSVNGHLAEFMVPSVQDGMTGSGADIMFARPFQGSALKPIDKSSIDHSELVASVDHATHRLRFYTDAADALAGEAVQRLVVEFPRAVLGRVRYDVSDPEAAPVVVEGEDVLTIIPESGVSLSDASSKNYLMASILPTSFDAADVMEVRMYTASKLARATIPLKGRTMAAGHSTAVKITPSSVSNYCRLTIRFAENNLGETVQSVRFSAPEGCRFSDNGGNEWTYAPDGGIDGGHELTLEFEDESAFRSLSGQPLQLTYDSDHVTVNAVASIPDLSGLYSATLSLNVPYLLFEDFASVTTFSNADEYGTANAGTKGPYTFLDGWSGGRVGGQAGQCIRIACRRETSANYPARVDSAPINAKLKKAADIDVTFDYGANNRYGGIAIITDGNVGQTCHVGYITTLTNYASNSTSGTYEGANSFYVKEYTGSWTNTPNNTSYVLHGVPAEDVVRISFRTDIESQAGTTNTTAWLYLDNIKVRIAKN